MLAIAAVACRAPGGRRQEAGQTRLTRFGGYVEALTRRRKHDQTSKVGTGDTRSDETISEQNLNLETEGYVYHPNFMEFALGGLFGLIQHELEDEYAGRQRSSSDNGTVEEFDLSATFLKKKKYPGYAFARRYQALVPRPFASSLETITTNYGLVWQYLSDKMPTNFRFNHSQIELNSLDTGQEQGLRKNTSFRLETSYIFAENNILTGVYNRESILEKPFELDYDSDEFILSHKLDFGREHRHRLDSELSYFDQRGTFEIERLRWREGLRLQHTENLRSWYQFEALDRTQGSLAGVPPIEETSYYLAGTVEHKLYDSLVSQLFGFVQTQRFGSGLDIDRTAVQVNFNYRKNNPWGFLQANYRARLQKESRTGLGQRVEIVDESHTFVDPQPVILAQTNISVGSIFLTAQDRVTFYSPGRDYSVRVFPDRVELRRVPTGRIQDGETVLVDYTYDQGGPFDLDTINQDLSIRQNFDFGLAPYYRLRWQDQTITPANVTGAVANDITAQIIGAEFRRWSLRLTAEYEDHDSTISPFEAVRLNGSYLHRFEFGATAAIKANWADFKYQPPDPRKTTFFTIEGRYRHPITDSLTVEGAVLYRTEDDSISGKDKGIDVDLSLQWKIRQTEVRVEYKVGKFEDRFATNDSSTLFLQVRRRF
jgi:hypothetical protein